MYREGQGFEPLILHQEEVDSGQLTMKTREWAWFTTREITKQRTTSALFFCWKAEELKQIYSFEPL